MERRVITALAVVFALPSLAHAAWINQTKEDPFNGDVHLAINAGPPGYALGFRCTNADDRTLVLVTPERATDKADDPKIMNVMKPNLLVIVDKSEKLSFAAEVEAPDTGDRAATYTFSTGDPAISDLLQAISAAKTRVAIAVEVLGKNFHSTIFDVSGSSRALGGLVKACGLKPAP